MEDFLNCWGRALPGQMVVAGGQRVTVCAVPASRPAPSQTRPSLGPQPPVPTVLGHRTWSPHQRPATQPGQAWAGVSPSPPPPRAIPHPRLRSRLGCTASQWLPPLTTSAAHTLKDSSGQPSQSARPFVTWARLQLHPRLCESPGGRGLLMGSLTSHFLPFPDLWRGRLPLSPPCSWHLWGCPPPGL